MNVTEVRDSDFKNAFPGIFNFTVGILIWIVQRKKVVLGEYEPTETECEWNYDEEEDEDENQVKIEEVNEKSGEVKDETSNSEMVCSYQIWME